GCQSGVSQAAASARGRLEAGAPADQVGDQPALFVEDDGAVGNPDLEISACGTIAVVARTLLAGRRDDVRMEVEVQQRVHLGIDDQHDAAATATITAVGAAERLELFTGHLGASLAPVYRPRC